MGNCQYQCQCPLVESSLSPCRKKPCSLHLAKKMEMGMGGGSVTDKGRKTWGRERGEGDEGITKLKIVISAAAERKQCLLLGEACLAACSRGWEQHCGMTLPLNVYCLCSRQTRDNQSAQGRGAERTGWIVLGN